MGHSGELEIRLLGPFEALLDGQVVNVGGRRQRSVLAMLALHVNRVVSAAALSEGLWGEEGLDRPSNNLQVYIYNLRRILEPLKEKGEPYRLIVSRDPGYLLRLGPEHVDAARFEAAVTAARGLRRRSDAVAAIERYLDAESGWRGRALEDLVFEPFAASEVNRLETTRLDALEERIELQLHLGLHHDLVGQLELLVHDHPFREGLRAQLMLCLYRCQRQADALKTFEEGEEALLEHLGLDPGPRLSELRMAILNHDPGLDMTDRRVATSEGDDRRPVGSNVQTMLGPPGPLPRPLTSLIGRHDETEQVLGSIESVVVTTVVGVAGCGKSRVALAAATAFANASPTGAYVVDLGAVEDPREVSARICQELDIRGGQEMNPGERIVDALHDQSALVVLDNCDRVIEPTAKLAGEIARSTSQCRLLLTSREALRIPGEVVIEVLPLSVPPTDVLPADAGGYEAVELFVERARSVEPKIELNAETTQAIVELVTYLDGVPLAIELVASRLRSLSVRELAMRLGHRLKVLDMRHRTLDARQETLRTTIDWSFDLLTESERSTLCQLSVFNGGWTLNAAEQVWRPENSNDDVIDLIDRLVGKSLATAREAPMGRRFRMPEIIREYALQKIDADGRRHAVEKRLAQWCTEYARSCASDLLESSDVSIMDALEVERGNLLHAAIWLLDNEDSADGLRIVEIMTELWIRRGRWSEARTWITRALGSVHSPAEPAKDEAAGRLMATLATVCIELGDDVAAQQWATQAVRLFESCSLEGQQASAISVLGRARRAAGDLDGAESLFRDARERYRRSANDRGEAIAIRDLGVIARLRGDNRLARSLLEEGLSLFRGAIHSASAPGVGRVPARGLSEFVNQLGSIAEKEGDVTAAHELLNEGFGLASQRGNIIGIAESLVSLGFLNLQQGNATVAAQLLGAVRAMCDGNQTVLSRAAESGRRSLEEAVTSALGLDACEAAERAGESLSPDAVVKLALSH